MTKTYLTLFDENNQHLGWVPKEHVTKYTVREIPLDDGDFEQELVADGVDKAALKNIFPTYTKYKEVSAAEHADMLTDKIITLDEEDNINVTPRSHTLSKENFIAAINSYTTEIRKQGYTYNGHQFSGDAESISIMAFALITQLNLITLLLLPYLPQQQLIF